jgi:hypothetical protein
VLNVILKVVIHDLRNPVSGFSFEGEAFNDEPYMETQECMGVLEIVWHLQLCMADNEREI